MGLEKLTNHARESLLRASKIARTLRTDEVTTVHLVMAISEKFGSMGQNLLSNVGITTEMVIELATGARTKANMTKASDKTTSPELSSELKNVITQAYQIAGKNGYPYVGTEHIAYALLSSAPTELKAIINDAKVKKEIIANIADTPASDSPIPNLTKIFDFPGIGSEDEESDSGALEHFCSPVLPEDAKTIIGRDDEVSRMITILGRREKSNPLLIGEPGVGKTALVEALAQRIEAGSVPAPLLDTEIIALDMATLVAGTTFRGEFEARIKDIITEAEDNPQVILFIDELHTIIGAGNGQGALDAANILKPALARGKLRIIGATTHAEYKKIAKDTALARRFQPITVREPSRDECVAMLHGVAPHYARFHGIDVSNKLLAQITDLSIRYLPDRFLPDKALDILDEAAAELKMKEAHNPKFKEIAKIRRELRAIGGAKLTAVNSEDYAEALELRTSEQRLSNKLRKLERAINTQTNSLELTYDDVVSGVATLAKIPISRIVTGNSRNISLTLADWRKKIVGQNAATETIAKTIMRSYSGLSPEARPTGSFLFLGPSGIGKTLAGTTLADSLFDQDSLIRIDMSELMEKHSIAKLIGAPAGYVGHEEGGSLTERIRIRPYSVVLFDEIEKAHPDTLNILLQILEDGTLTDAAGARADFRHAVIILTSNIGTRELTQVASLGFNADSAKSDKAVQFSETKEKVLKTLRSTLAPELLNRIDDIIVFETLGRAELTDIARIETIQLQTRLAKNGIKLRYSNTLAPTIAAKADPTEGARNIRRLIRQHLEDPLAEILLNTTKKPTITISTTKGTPSKREIIVK